MLISSKELAERSGASYRQIDYWCRLGIICPIGDSRPGYGKVREWNDAIVERVKLMAELSTIFRGMINTDILNRVYDNYNLGEIDLAFNITLKWKVPN